MSTSMMDDLDFMNIAYQEAKAGYEEGGIPIGAVLVAADGQILGRGRNMRIQKQSATLHAEISALENAGRLDAKSYSGSTMYTTLSPCQMCTGACLLYKVSRVVLGENENFLGGEEHLKQTGVEVHNMRHEPSRELMQRYIRENAEDWYQDIGESIPSAR
ncbi:protein of unknown function [Taphrina deformans PYCC 5710]|uniref:Cytosine deaminase n=1 Tax=Taphrina deformans (strain PYCC 5710 / ATCC 11124 / CBS 356.35 / IMI 108563 / JCM 9778 / NBRC 8474) TaxID=1097556 RepID=R4XP86_TAPDE|nr:protein of unknown function [Taphrina deformans PYCC 5710]|eukprot:CCG85060.1 protein of unknown function [Taphrina deformans PYCC 5710]